MIKLRVYLEVFLIKIKVHNVRPATVCGLSPRMRLDVAVNMLHFNRLKMAHKGIWRKSDIRPNIHIDDMIRVYEHFLNHPGLPNGEYNAGFENISILDIAKIIKQRQNQK